MKVDKAIADQLLKNLPDAKSDKLENFLQDAGQVKNFSDFFRVYDRFHLEVMSGEFKFSLMESGLELNERDVLPESKESEDKVFWEIIKDIAGLYVYTKFESVDEYLESRAATTSLVALPSQEMIGSFLKLNISLNKMVDEIQSWDSSIGLNARGKNLSEDIHQFIDYITRLDLTSDDLGQIDKTTISVLMSEYIEGNNVLNALTKFKSNIDKIAQEEKQKILTFLQIICTLWAREKILKCYHWINFLEI